MVTETNPTFAQKEKPICATCKTDDVRRDAFASWDVETQSWELSETYDYSHCNNCEGEARLEWVPATDSAEKRGD